MQKNILLLALFVATVVACSHYPADPAKVVNISMAEQGVGPISPQTPFDLETMKRLLPNYQVKKGTAMSEGMDYPTIVVSDHSGVLVTINPKLGEGTILSIYTERVDVENYLGLTIGSKFAGIFTQNSYRCFPGVEEKSGNVFCMAPHSQRLLLEFVGEWGGPDGVLPPEGVVKDYRVATVHWLASTP